MELVNDTDVPAALYRAQLIYRDLLLATCVVKTSWEIGPDGAVAPVGDPLLINEGDVETSLGTLAGDVVPIKDGCDLAIYGPAVSPDRPVTEMEVVIRIGDFKRELAVIGDRTWTGSLGRVRSSAPQPFTVMPLDYSRAFGGHAVQVGALEAAYPDNPGGCGLVLGAEHAAGTRLPNVEEPDQRITAWDQRPLPAGLLPLPRDSALRGLRGVDVDLELQRTRLLPAAFLSAHPRMVLPRYPAGAVVDITGMTADRHLRFRLPKAAFEVEVALGDVRYRLRLVADALGIIPGSRRFWVVYRRAFVYQFVPHRTREVRVTEVAAAGEDTPTTTIAAELAAARPRVPIESEDPPERMPLPFEYLREQYPLTAIIEALPLCASG